MKFNGEAAREAPLENKKPETAGADRTSKIEARMAAIETRHPPKLDRGFLPKARIDTDLIFAEHDLQKLAAEQERLKGLAPKHPAMIIDKNELMRGKKPKEITIETPALDAKIEKKRAEIGRLRGIKEAFRTGDAGPADKYFQDVRSGLQNELAAATEKVDRLRQNIAKGRDDLKTVVKELEKAIKQEEQIARKLQDVTDQLDHLHLMAQLPVEKWGLEE